ncbi:ABC transporter permease [Alicyclobacillus kakegawensis]|uniref:ABC transporter permease n=1 Tax=Alicyclobacillus kakegawensis TaxID=392012 RepID=UPI000834E0DC|nr:ABC transporter permease [Alicyclobacillus kakegawensis]
MGAYILRRLLGMIPMLFAITVFVFLLMHAAPGNAIDGMLNPRIQNIDQLKQHLREINGLNKPLWQQYVIWLRNFVQGNWGYSFSQHVPVRDVIGPALVNTLLLAAMAEVFILIIGVPLGIYQSRNPYGGFDNTASVVNLILFSIPYYIVGIFAIYLLAIKLPIFPSQNAVGTGPDAGTLMDHIYHALLPALSVALTSSAVYSRYTRGSMLDVARRDFTRTAYAKGLREGEVFRKHVFRNGMIPIVTQFGFDIGGLIGGAVIVENLFAYQGMGYVTLQAATTQDYNVIMATTLLIAIGVLIGNLIADILYAVVDPRIRYD